MRTLYFESKILRQFTKRKMQLKQNELDLKKGTYKNQFNQRKIYATINVATILPIEWVLLLIVATLFPISLQGKISLTILYLSIRYIIPFGIYFFGYSERKYHQLCQKQSQQLIILQKQLNLTQTYFQENKGEQKNEQS